MRRLTKHVFAVIHREVEKQAKELGVGGFMVVADRITGVMMYGYVNNVGGPVLWDTDGSYNVVAIAFTKIGMVLAHLRDTGDTTGLVEGEVPWKGGQLSDDAEFAYAFSGAKQEQDHELMLTAENAHAKCTGDEQLEIIDPVAAERLGASIAESGKCPVCKQLLLFDMQSAMCTNCNWSGVNLAWFHAQTS